MPNAIGEVMSWLRDGCCQKVKKIRKTSEKCLITKGDTIIEPTHCTDIQHTQKGGYSVVQKL